MISRTNFPIEDNLVKDDIVTIANPPHITPEHAKMREIIQQGQRIIAIEADALAKLGTSLDESFFRTIQIIKATKGRLIITGMGKSGHIGRKFAATLSSTGQPAYFVHPSEASHGDLGMITTNDGVIALSNSGETTELVAIIQFCRRTSIPLIGLTKEGHSSLAKNANVAVLIPDLPEACPHNLAPTTSTCLMLALCDALAVVLLEQKRFSAKDFHHFHPGGRLGRRLCTLNEIMHQGESMPLVDQETLLSDAIVEMTKKRFGAVGILHEGRLAGIITDGDLRRIFARSSLDNLKAGDVMSKNPVTMSKQEIAESALACLHRNKVTILFIVDDEQRPLGVIHIHDLL